MLDIIGTGLVLNECELAAIIGSGNNERIFGFELSGAALSHEGRAKGINSMLRRGALRAENGCYLLCSEYREILDCIRDPEEWYSVGPLEAIISRKNGMNVLVREITAEEQSFSLTKVNARSFSDILEDEGIISADDEDSLLERSLPDKDTVLQMFGTKEYKLCISTRNKDRQLAVMQTGLCKITAALAYGELSCELYSRNGFEKKLAELLEGGEK